VIEAYNIALKMRGIVTEIISRYSGRFKKPPSILIPFTEMLQCPSYDTKAMADFAWNINLGTHISICVGKEKL